MNETSILLWVHAHSSPLLDSSFRLTQWAGGTYACGTLAALMTALNWSRGDRPRACRWLALGASTFVLYFGLKHALGRARPDLWPWLVREHGYAFPSGHALGTATFYPLLALDLSADSPGRRRLFLAFAFAGTLLVGYGRLYLGVHWPSDVLGGWTLGAAQLAAGLALFREARASASPADAEKAEQET